MNRIRESWGALRGLIAAFGRYLNDRWTWRGQKLSEGWAWCRRWKAPLLIGAFAFACIGAVELKWGSEASREVAKVGLPPLFAALLVWSLTESTRDRDRLIQERRELRDRDVEIYRQLQRDVGVLLTLAVKANNFVTNQENATNITELFDGVVTLEIDVSLIDEPYLKRKVLDYRGAVVKGRDGSVPASRDDEATIIAMHSELQQTIGGRIIALYPTRTHTVSHAGVGTVTISTPAPVSRITPPAQTADATSSTATPELSQPSAEV